MREGYGGKQMRQNVSSCIWVVRGGVGGGIHLAICTEIKVGSIEAAVGMKGDGMYGQTTEFPRNAQKVTVVVRETQQRSDQFINHGT